MSSFREFVFMCEEVNTVKCLLSVCSICLRKLIQLNVFFPCVLLHVWGS